MASTNLALYRQKRNFARTQEPEGKSRSRRAKSLSFVVQQHHASHAHYDFRLELDGVLKSWAVPKGPSLDSSDKRLAVEVEDHPLEYAAFEGGIPKGQYGGGTVIVWDHGTWTPLEADVRQSLKRGSLKFTLDGEKLKGAWALVRMRTNAPKPQWLLIKEHDKYAKAHDVFDVLTQRPKSVLSNRTIEQVKAKLDKKHETQSVKPAPKSRLAAVERKTLRTPRIILPTSAIRSSPPVKFLPQLATRAEQVPDSDEWLHEVKFDGYRIISHLDGASVRMCTRTGLDWSSKFSRLADHLRRWNVGGTILDGEVVALDSKGVSRFQALQQAIKSNSSDELCYFVFDVPFWNTNDLRHCTLEERREVLAAVFKHFKRQSNYILLSESTSGDPKKVVGAACKLGLEGIVCKRRESPYVSARTSDWLKVRCGNRQEVVVIGYTEPKRNRVGLGALLIGYYKGRELVFAGKVGTGFSNAVLNNLIARLSKQKIDKPIVRTVPADVRTAHWVKPTLVAEVSFSEWTTDGRLRHPVFLGLREDKPVSEIVREKAESRPPEAAVKVKRAASSVVRRKVSRSSKNDEVRGVTITHPSRLMFAGTDVTKLELAHYYDQVSELILPYMKDRPLSMLRCPDGSAKMCFFQKHMDIDEKGLEQVPIKEKSKEANYVTCNNTTGLIHLVQMNCIEFHGWGSRASNIEAPDCIVMDLDPGEKVVWKQVVDAAELVRNVLQDVGLSSFVKTTGGKGLHVVSPLRPDADWTCIKEFTKQLATAMEQRHPALYVANMAKRKRAGRVFIDYLRNQRGATSVLPYCVRARPGAPVAMPVEWRQLSRVKPDQFSIETALKHVHQRANDPWQDFNASRKMFKWCGGIP